MSPFIRKCQTISAAANWQKPCPAELLPCLFTQTTRLKAHFKFKRNFIRMNAHLVCKYHCKLILKTRNKKKISHLQTISFKSIFYHVPDSVTWSRQFAWY